MEGKARFSVIMIPLQQEFYFEFQGRVLTQVSQEWSLPSFFVLHEKGVGGIGAVLFNTAVRPHLQDIQNLSVALSSHTNSTGEIRPKLLSRGYVETRF